MDLIETPIENSPYRVVDRRGIRYLLPKGQDRPTFSVMRLGRPDAVVRPYARTMLQWLALVPQPRDVLLIGLGGGELARCLRTHLPQVRLVAVEIDPAMVDIAHRHFGLRADDERLSVVVADGAAHVRGQAASCDVLMVDVWDSVQAYPDGMAGEAFFADCRDALRGNGPLVVNLYRSTQDWRRRYARALGKSFPFFFVFALSETQHVVMAFKDLPELDWPQLAARSRELEPTFRIGLPAFWAACQARACMAVVE